MKQPITNKQQMYDLLLKGELGNTIEAFMSLDAWKASPTRNKYPLWMVRTLKPGGPLSVNCPRDEVEETASRPEFQDAGVCIAYMITSTYQTIWQGDVMRTTDGLTLVGNSYPPLGYNWRDAMKSPESAVSGVRAAAKLRYILNPDSYDDVEYLLDEYPDHVVELSVFERSVGVIPNRNYVTWEVRKY